MLALASGLAPAGCGPAPPRTSVLLVTVDTLRADHLGCYGYRRTTSPHIDRLASEGALFERTVVSLPRTTQSIASILTGRYPKGHGARGLFSTLPSANLTLAEVLQGEGYATAAIVSNLFLRPGQGFEQGFERYENPPGRWDGDSASEITGAALAWLRGRPAGRPFFLWVHYLDPHWAYRPLPPFDRAFDSAFAGPFTLYEDLAAGRLTKGQVIFANPLTPRQVEHVVALYDGEIAQADAAIGRLLDEAATLVRGPLLVVLTADHGESLGEHGYHFAHGEYLYEPGLRVPLLLRLPGRIPAGLRTDALAQNIDVAPTILSLLGIHRLQSVDGRPLLLPEAPGAAPVEPGVARAKGGALRPAPGRSLVFAESDFQLIHPENRRYYIPGPAGKWSAASDGRYKLIHIPTPGGERIEMYDLGTDPGETTNLEGSASAAEPRARLLRALRQFVDYDRGAGAPASPEPDPEERERLRSLGYIN
jgi:arylsulfatase A-like enzyme